MSQNTIAGVQYIFEIRMNLDLRCCTWAGKTMQQEILQNAEGQPLAPVKDIPQQDWWLIVHQWVFSHSVVHVHKNLMTGFPEYLCEKLQSENNYGKNFQTKIRLLADRGARTPIGTSRN